MKRKTVKTVRFYTSSDRYMGWKYARNTTLPEVDSWVRSGNSCKIGGRNISCLDDVEQYVFDLAG